MIEVLIVGGSRDGEIIGVADGVDYIDLIPKSTFTPRYNVSDADKSVQNLTFIVETYRIDRYRGTATLC